MFGVWAPHEDVAKLAYYGLYALQHRGQESAGIAVSDGSRIMVHKEMGLVAQVFDEPALTALRGHIAVGHCRYSTTGASVWANAQPTFRSTGKTSLALGHNGNLINTRELAALLDAPGRGSTGIAATSDTDVLTALFLSDRAALNVVDAGPAPDGGSADPAASVVETAAATVLPLAKGAYSLVFMDEQTLYAARDPHGFRPLVLGRLDTGWVVASETAALDIVGARFVREIAPGELVCIDGRGVRSRTFAAPKPSGCLFEYVYLARPDTTISGRGVHATRVAVGRQLAAEHPADADLVIPVPESGTPAAIGFAEASGIPFGQGLVKNSYVGRTFIQPSQTIRERGIKLKLVQAPAPPRPADRLGHDAADATLGLFSATGFTDELAVEATASRGKILLATVDDLYRQPSSAIGLKVWLSQTGRGRLAGTGQAVVGRAWCGPGRNGRRAGASWMRCTGCCGRRSGSAGAAGPVAVLSLGVVAGAADDGVELDLQSLHDLCRLAWSGWSAANVLGSRAATVQA